MRLVFKLIILITLTFISLTDFMFAQQDTTEIEMVRIKLTDGSTIVGDIIEEDEKTIIIRTLSNLEIKVPKENITEREIIKGQIEKGEFWRDDPNQTRMFFTSTGKGLKQGHGYFSVYEIFFPFVAVGITDWFTLAGGMSLIPGLDGQLFYIAPKFTPLQVTNFDASVGVIYVAVPKEDEGDGIAYGVATYGTEKASVTLGMGFGFTGADFGDQPIIVVGGEIRVSNSIKLLSENWFVLAEGVNLLSFGLRFFGENLAADFGLVFTTEGGDGFPFLPWLGFAYNF